MGYHQGGMMPWWRADHENSHAKQPANDAVIDYGYAPPELRFECNSNHLDRHQRDRDQNKCGCSQPSA